jgi:hypothetical protein
LLQAFEAEAKKHENAQLALETRLAQLERLVGSLLKLPDGLKAELAGGVGGAQVGNPAGGGCDGSSSAAECDQEPEISTDGG